MRFSHASGDYGAIDENSEILQYPEFMEIFFKMLRADFTLSENYEYDGIRTGAAIAALCGTEESHGDDRKHAFVGKLHRVGSLLQRVRRRAFFHRRQYR